MAQIANSSFSGNLTYDTPIRLKTNTSSIYLNLERSSSVDGTVRVEIWAGDDGRICNIIDQSYDVCYGRKYMLINFVKENKHSYVKLRFIGSGSISGVWSPDSVPESNCIIMK
jgi:hypothetical protein